MTTAVTVVDEPGSLQGTAPITDLPERLSSQKNLHLHSPYMKVHRKLSYANWLGQT
jgi:hypothetical protein